MPFDLTQFSGVCIFTANKIRNTLKDICVFFFAGVSSPNIDRHNYNVCTSSFKFTNITVQTSQDYVLLPIVDSYFNLGNKLYHMIKWTSQLKANVVLYLDMDVAEKMTPKNIVQMFVEVKKYDNVIVGDILDCLMPANQLCCCGNNLYFSLTHFYESSTPYEVFPPIMWGGGGIGFDDIAIQNMIKVNTRIHFSSDHTISAWARQVNVRFHQSSWSHMHFKWCPKLINDIQKINATSWKCNAHTFSKTHTFSKMIC